MAFQLEFFSLTVLNWDVASAPTFLTIFNVYYVTQLNVAIFYTYENISRKQGGLFYTTT